MKSFSFTKQTIWLLSGDILILGAVTLYGFASHEELNAGGRILTTFLPLVAAWLLIAPFVGVYQPDHSQQLRSLWRPFWAMILAAPMMGFLRALWLGGVVSPLFVIIMGGVSALALLAWRGIYAMFASRKSPAYERS